MQPLLRKSTNWTRFLDSRWGSRMLGLSWRRLHSPMLFVWARALQSNPRHWPSKTSGLHACEGYPKLLNARKAWLRDSTPIQRVDLGAGSRVRLGSSGNLRSISELAQSSLTPRGEVESLCRWLGAVAEQGRFLELGTSLGWTSAAVASVGWDVETWEGCPQTLAVARDMWQELGVPNLQSRLGDFRVLVRDLSPHTSWDVVYLDGLHEEQSTKDLVDALAPHVKVALVVDDIAWSPGMHRAWCELQSRPEWRVSFSWRGRGFLLKAPQMERQRLRLG